MATTDDEGHLRRIFLKVLAEQKALSAELLQEEDSDAYRARFAELYPLIAKAKEKMTQQDRKELVREVAIAEAVAHTIAYALAEYEKTHS